MCRFAVQIEDETRSETKKSYGQGQREPDGVQNAEYRCRMQNGIGLTFDKRAGHERRVRFCLFEFELQVQDVRRETSCETK